jgi:hypothetical protein
MKNIKRTISQEEISARLNLASELNKCFPFLKDHYKIFSNISTDMNGNELGSLGIEIVNKQLNGETIELNIILEKYLKEILNDDIKKENDKLREEIKLLKSNNKKNENKL